MSVKISPHRYFIHQSLSHRSRLYVLFLLSIFYSSWWEIFHAGQQHWNESTPFVRIFRSCRRSAGDNKIYKTGLGIVWIPALWIRQQRVQTSDESIKLNDLIFSWNAKPKTIIYPHSSFNMCSNYLRHGGKADKCHGSQKHRPEEKWTWHFGGWRKTLPGWLPGVLKKASWHEASEWENMFEQMQWKEESLHTADQRWRVLTRVVWRTLKRHEIVLPFGRQRSEEVRIYLPEGVFFLICHL